MAQLMMQYPESSDEGGIGSRQMCDIPMRRHEELVVHV